MDIDRFDALTRAVSAGQPRRGLLRTFLAGVVAVAGVASMVSLEADAKKRKRKKKTCKGDTKKCGKACVDLLSDAGNCGSCGNACVSGACVHGACTCLSVDDCPDGCFCSPRNQGGGACTLGAVDPGCDIDEECPVGSICTQFVELCSKPCLG